MNWLTKTFAGWRQKFAGSLVSVSGSRGWWPLIRELTTGGWQRNEDVHVDTVLSNPTLYAVVTLIAGDIAKLRPKLVEQDRNGIWTETSSAAFSPVLYRPNHYQLWIEYVEWYMLSKLNHGNTYVLKARDDRNVVSALYVLDPFRVKPLVATDGSVFYRLYVDELNQAEDVVVPAREMIHDVMCPLFHPLAGVSPIYAAGYPAMQGLNIRNASDKFFTNGSKPGGVLTAPGAISDETALRLKTYWDTNFSGDNTGKIAVLGDGLRYEGMAMTAEQSRLVEQLHFTDEDICKAFHMPRHKVGVGPDPTYNNIEALNKMYYSDCLQKLIEKFEVKHDDAFNLRYVPERTLGIELDRAALFEMDSSAKADAATKAIQAGMSPNEVRFRFYDLGPVQGGESPYIQEQNWPLRLLSQRELPAREPTAPAPMPPVEGEVVEDEEEAPEKMLALPRMVQQKLLALRGTA